jgi:hypothetical protein
MYRCSESASCTVVSRCLLGGAGFVFEISRKDSKKIEKTRKTKFFYFFSHENDHRSGVAIEQLENFENLEITKE